MARKIQYLYTEAKNIVYTLYTAHYTTHSSKMSVFLFQEPHKHIANSFATLACCMFCDSNRFMYGTTIIFF